MLAYLFTRISVKSKMLILLYAVTKDGPAQIYKNIFYFLLPVQDLGMDNVFEEIWQKGLKFPSSSSSACIRMRKHHFAYKVALIIWNLLLLWFKIKDTSKFLCKSKLGSLDLDQPICWALCKWYELEAWGCSGFGQSQRLGFGLGLGEVSWWGFQTLRSSGVYRANYLGADWLDWLGMGQIFLGIPANMGPPTPPKLWLNQQAPEIAPHQAQSLVVISPTSLIVIVASLPTPMGPAVSPGVRHLHSYPHFTVITKWLSNPWDLNWFWRKQLFLFVLITDMRMHVRCKWNNAVGFLPFPD